MKKFEHAEEKSSKREAKENGTHKAKICIDMQKGENKGGK
jgi:hypothetical protein